eukprot:3936531-Rhodomonas_salina.1
MGAGLGLFNWTGRDIQAGEWLTEYGGETIGENEAAERKEAGNHTHILSLGFKNICLDGRCRGLFSMDYYTVVKHAAGSFANTAARDRVNARYERTDVKGYQQYVNAEYVGKRTFLKATKTIPDKAEIFCPYDRQFALALWLI